MNLLHALATVSSMTMLSRVLGFVRDSLIARTFGAGLFSDAFFVAFRLPNLLRRMFAEGAFSQAFVPILGEYKNRRGHDDTRALIEHVASMLGLVLIVITTIGIAAAPFIVWISAPGFRADPNKFAFTVDLLRITFPYILFISLTSLAGSVLNTWSRFAIPAFTPSLLNLSFIVFTLWLTPYFDPSINALAWAVLVGGLAQLLFQIPFLLKLGLMPRFRLAWRDAGVWRVARQMVPALFGVSIGQISLLINTIFASFLVTGSVSWLYYADRLMEFPTGLLGVALGTILLPSLSKSHAERTTEEFSRLLDWGLRLTCLLAIPCAVALAVLAVPLIATLFHRGQFGALDVAMTESALLAYSLGLCGLIFVKVLAPGFYSRQNIRTPVKIGVMTLAATQVMNYVFVHYLDLAHAGLALAISLGACVNAALLFGKLRSHAIYHPQAGWLKFAAKVTLAALLMAVLLRYAAGPAPAWLTASEWWRMSRLAVLVLLGAATYLGSLWVMGIRLRDFAKRV
jgi:putative peptidoglycan lipid II flippase